MTFDLPNLRHLRVFCEVARRRSVRAAAQHVHLSQPAVTQAIAKLESDFGVMLFDRRRDGMYLTEIGERLFVRADAALEHIEAGAREAARVGLRRSGQGFASFDRLLTSTQLRALAAISDASNFSMAARVLGVAQPSIHRAARTLENVSDITFFNSAPEGVSLTHAALALSHRAKLAFAEMRQAWDEVTLYLGRDSARIVVGSLPLARTAILPEAINAMVSSRQSVEIRVIDGTYATLLSRMRSGEIDFLVGALRNPPPAHDVEQERLFDDPLAIVAGRQHPLARQAHVALSEIVNWPWVAPPHATPAGSYLYGTLRIHERAQSPIRVVSSSLTLVRGLLTSGNYLTIISTHQIRHEIEQGLLTPLNVALTESSRAIGLTWRAKWRPTAAQHHFLDLIRHAAANAVTPPRRADPLPDVKNA